MTGGPTWLQMVVSIIVAVVASNGFWVFLQARLNKKSAQTQMLVGLGHDRILSLCNEYLNRGCITTEEYDNLYNYLYKPYIECGGNGTAKYAVALVQKLPHKATVEKEAAQ